MVESSAPTDTAMVIASALPGFAASADTAAMTLFLADSLACALGAASLEGSVVERLAAARRPEGGSATLWASGEKADTDTAAFLNAVAVRFLDSNDTYVSKGIVHPSDVLPALIALAEERQVPWQRLLEACTIAYEVMCRLTDVVNMSPRGFDGSSLSPIATAAGASWLIGLNRHQTADALRIAVIDAGTLRAVRQGKLSDWKAMASARGSIKGLFAVRMAEAGCVPPGPAFDGENGFLARISGAFTFDDGAASRVARVILKVYPAQIFIQGMLRLARDLHLQLAGRSGAIEAISIRTFARAVELVGGRDHPFATLNRATADHSAPFCVSAMLLAGRLDHDDYEPLLADPRLGRLMEKTAVEEDEDATPRYPEKFPCELRVTLNSGETLTARLESPAGLSAEDLSGKFSILWPETMPRQWRWSLPGNAPIFPVHNR